MADGKDVLPAQLEQGLIDELARAALERVAPEELVLFDETAAEYFRDPESLLAARRRDKAVGFGLDMAMLTPYVLAVGTAVVQFLVSTVMDTVRDEAKPVIARLVRRLFRHAPQRPADQADAEHPATTPTPSLTVAQARDLRRIALQQAGQVGLDEDRATLLADAFVGAVLTGI